MADVLQVHPWSSFPTVENRVTAPDEPGRENRDHAEAAFAYEFLGLGEEYRERHLDEHTALTYSAYFACIRLISQNIASLPWNNFASEDDGKTRIEIEDDISWILDLQANPEVSALDWRQVMMVEALVGGNGYSEIERTNSGRIQWMWHIARDRVNPDRAKSGQLVYEVKNGSGVKNTILFPEEIFHLKGLGPDGLVGWSVLEFARRTLQLGLDEDNFSSKFFGRGPVPSGVLKLAMPKQTPEQHKETKRTFLDAYGGRKNLAGVIVLSGGNEFTPLPLPNTDAQMLESKKYSAEDVCRFFGVAPHLIGLLDRATNNNIEELALEHVKYCLLIWARRLETESAIKLFGRRNRGRRFTKLDFEEFERGNLKAFAESLTAQVTGGYCKPNEAREKMGRNPDPDGNVLMIQGAMKPLKDAINPPAPSAPAAPPAAPPGQAMQSAVADDAPPLPEVVETFTRLLTDAYDRLLRVELDKAKRAAWSQSKKTKTPDKLAEHIATFYDENHLASITNDFSIGVIHAGFLLAIGRKPLPDVTAHRAKVHLTCSRELLAKDSVPESWMSRAKIQAEADLRALIEASQVVPTAKPKAPDQLALTVNLPKPDATVVNVTLPKQEPAIVNLTQEATVINLTNEGTVVNMPKQEPPTVNVTVPPQEAPVVNNSFDVIVPSQPPPVVSNTVNVPPAEVKVENTVNVPEQPKAEVKVENTVNVPAQEPPTVTVNVPKTTRKTARKKDGKWIIGEDE